MPVEILRVTPYRSAHKTGLNTSPRHQRGIMPLKRASRKRFLAVVRNPAWICLIWFGMTSGVSLLATPVRFSAPSITRAIALDVGQVVFAVLNKAEFVALILLLIVVRVSDTAKSLWAGCGVLALILLAQALWLLPALAARTQQIIAGTEPASSIVHGAYSLLELSKLLLLLYLGFRSMQMLATATNDPNPVRTNK